MEAVKIPKRILGTLLNSLGAGVVPRTGLEYVAIGRQAQIGAVLADMENIRQGMGACRFFVGKYGSGKSFLIGLLRANATQRGFVCADADLSPERRFVGTKGHGVATYRELMNNLSVKECPERGALEAILTGWLARLTQEAMAATGLSPDREELQKEVVRRIYGMVDHLKGFVNGFAFVQVLEQYYLGYATGNEAQRSDSLRWLRGEFSSRLEARGSEVRVNTIIDDTNWYDYIKLWAAFFVALGYHGFLVFFDECVNLYKIANRLSRENNYEKILSMFNDTLQGKAPHLGLFFGGTPLFLEDPRRGLYSYEALKSRLEAGRFVQGHTDMLSPVIRLERLSDDELFALVCRLRTLHARYYSYQPRLTDDQLLAFLQACFERMGAEELITPREITRDFLGILNVMMQEPQLELSQLLGRLGATAPAQDPERQWDLEIPAVEID